MAVALFVAHIELDTCRRGNGGVSRTVEDGFGKLRHSAADMLAYNALDSAIFDERAGKGGIEKHLHACFSSQVVKDTFHVFVVEADIAKAAPRLLFIKAIDDFTD